MENDTSNKFPDPEEEKFFRDSLTGDKFWVGVPGDGSLPIVSTKHTDVDIIHSVVRLIDNIGLPLQVNPDGTTQWLIGTGKKGGGKRKLTDTQLQEAVGGYFVEHFTYYVNGKRTNKRAVYLYAKQKSTERNPFASAMHGLIPIMGPVVVMPKGRKY